MSRRHYFDYQDDMDYATYNWLGSRYTGIEAGNVGKLPRKWRARSDELESREQNRKPKRVRERLN